MNKMIITVDLLVSAVCLFSCVIVMDDAVADDSISTDVFEVDRSIVIMTDRPVVGLNCLDERMKFQSTFESIGPDDIVVLDGLWVEAQDQSTVYDDVKALVDNGSPVLLVANSPEAISYDKIGYSTGYSPSAHVYGVIYDPSTGAVYCNSVSHVDMSKSFDTVIHWADSHISDRYSGESE